MSKYDDTFTLSIKLQGQDQTMPSKSILHIVSCHLLHFLLRFLWRIFAKKSTNGIFFKEKKRRKKSVTGKLRNGRNGIKSLLIFQTTKLTNAFNLDVCGREVERVGRCTLIMAHILLLQRLSWVRSLKTLTSHIHWKGYAEEGHEFFNSPVTSHKVSGHGESIQTILSNLLIL